MRKLADLGDIKLLHQKVDGLDKKFEEIARKQLAALSSIHMKIDKTLPSLLHLLPSKQPTTVAASLARAASSLVIIKLRLFFVCPVSCKIAPTNDGEGFEVPVTRECLIAAPPYLRMALQDASALSKFARLAGLPIPDFEVMEKSMSDWLAGQLQDLTGLDSADSESVASLLSDSLMGATSHLASMATDSQTNLGEHEASKLRQSCEAVERLLERTAGTDWARKSGLVRVVSDDAAHVAWVMPGESELRFRRHGIKAFVKPALDSEGGSSARAR
eukprot:jgi/Tetstr1/449365/TSEL_003877.t1